MNTPQRRSVGAQFRHPPTKPAKSPSYQQKPLKIAMSEFERAEILAQSPQLISWGRKVGLIT